jgi:hypothetical protein
MTAGGGWRLPLLAAALRDSAVWSADGQPRARSPEAGDLSLPFGSNVEVSRRTGTTRAYSDLTASGRTLWVFVISHFLPHNRIPLVRKML